MKNETEQSAFSVAAEFFLKGYSTGMINSNKNSNASHHT